MSAIRFQQVRGTDIGVEPIRDQRHNIRESFDRLAPFVDEVFNLLKRQHVGGRIVVRTLHGTGTPLEVIDS